MITQGDQDPVVPVASVRTWAAAMDVPRATREYIEMPGRDHGSIIADGISVISRFFAANSRGSRATAGARGGYPADACMPCIPSQRTKASNQPVLVVSFGYIPKPCPPCS
jgi:hypothetical protein